MLALVITLNFLIFKTIAKFLLMCFIKYLPTKYLTQNPVKYSVPKNIQGTRH
jgi:hypothetical protein